MDLALMSPVTLLMFLFQFNNSRSLFSLDPFSFCDSFIPLFSPCLLVLLGTREVIGGHVVGICGSFPESHGAEPHQGT